MSESQGSAEFKALPEEQRRAYRTVSRELVELVQRYAIPLCFAPPLSIGGKVNGATGCILRLQSRSFLITANHVLTEFERRRENEPLNWQFGNLPPFDPMPRIAWKDVGRDVVLLRISEEEVVGACNHLSLVFSAMAGWPPPVPHKGQVVLVSGFPRILREVNHGTISAGPYSALFRITTTAKEFGQPLPKRSTPNSEYLPLRLTTEVDEDKKAGRLKVELLIGRGSWHFEIKHLLDKTLNVLLNHRWEILRPPDDLLWFTSDDPVVKLNYHNEYKYDFGGGWNKPGSEIMLPLSPRHLLFTHIGAPASPNVTVLPRRKAKLIRRFIAEHAHRMIFASTEDPQVRKLRPRQVNLEQVRHESEQWANWHRSQSAAEREFARTTRHQDEAHSS